METILLRNQVPMPLQGFGVFQITDSVLCEQAVTQALRTGYRLIDTAACYGNERAVGKAVAESGIPREDIFLVSKVWIQDAGYEQTKRSFSKTLANLGTDYLDLYLIHMPYGDYHGSWRAESDLHPSSFDTDRPGLRKDTGSGHFAVALAESDRVHSQIRT